MRFITYLLLPVVAETACFRPRNTERCPALMTTFSQSAAFSTWQSSPCFNFCDDIFQNGNTVFLGRFDQYCVTGCRLLDIRPGSTVGSTQFDSAPWGTWSATNAHGNQVQITGTTTTAAGQIDSTESVVEGWSAGSTEMIDNSNMVSGPTGSTAAGSVNMVSGPTGSTAAGSIHMVSGSTAAGQIATSNTGPVIGGPTQTTSSAQTSTPVPQSAAATVATVSSSATTTTGQSAVAPGRGTIVSAQITGPAGTNFATVTGAGKAVPWAASTNIASGSISRASCSKGKGGCGKGKSRMETRTYEALESSSPQSFVASLAATLILLLGVS